MRGERPEGLVFKSVAVVFGVLGEGFPDSRRAAGLRRNASEKGFGLGRDLGVCRVNAGTSESS